MASFGAFPKDATQEQLLLLSSLLFYGLTSLELGLWGFCIGEYNGEKQNPLAQRQEKIKEEMRKNIAYLQHH